MYSNNDIDEVKNIILGVVQPEEIILFGSYIDDSYNDESDIDIMVLLQKELLRKEKLQYLRNLYLAFFKNNLEVDIILKSKKKYEETKKYIGTINYEVSRNGKTIWKRN